MFGKLRKEVGEIFGKNRLCAWVVIYFHCSNIRRNIESR